MVQYEDNKGTRLTFEELENILEGEINKLKASYKEDHASKSYIRGLKDNINVIIEGIHALGRVSYKQEKRYETLETLKEEGWCPSQTYSAKTSQRIKSPLESEIERETLKKKLKQLRIDYYQGMPVEEGVKEMDSMIKDIKEKAGREYSDIEVAYRMFKEVLEVKKNDKNKAGRFKWV